jgi:hypothetical protein
MRQDDALEGHCKIDERSVFFSFVVVCIAAITSKHKLLGSGRFFSSTLSRLKQTLFIPVEMSEAWKNVWQATEY